MSRTRRTDGIKTVRAADRGDGQRPVLGEIRTSEDYCDRRGGGIPGRSHHPIVIWFQTGDAGTRQSPQLFWGEVCVDEVIQSTTCAKQL